MFWTDVLFSSVQSSFLINNLKESNDLLSQFSSILLFNILRQLHSKFPPIDHFIVVLINSIAKIRNNFFLIKVVFHHDLVRNFSPS